MKIQIPSPCLAVTANTLSLPIDARRILESACCRCWQGSYQLPSAHQRLLAQQLFQDEHQPYRVCYLPCMTGLCVPCSSQPRIMLAVSPLSLSQEITYHDPFPLCSSPPRFLLSCILFLLGCFICFARLHKLCSHVPAKCSSAFHIPITPVSPRLLTQPQSWRT